jgi:hypothetical protein
VMVLLSRFEAPSSGLKFQKVRVAPDLLAFQLCLFLLAHTVIVRSDAFMASKNCHPL